MKRIGKPMSWLRYAVIFLAGVVCSANAFAGTIHVPGDAATIQDAINKATNGDTVLVADGVYKGPANRNLDFKGKAITVQSENGPASCIIDCEQNGRGFYFHSGEGQNSVLSGFTITNGLADSGGGIYCGSSSPSISNCIVSGNTASTGRGGGIYLFDSSPTLSGCTIRQNLSSGYDSYGGGIYCNDSSLSLEMCTISGNSANGSFALYTGGKGQGGGIYSIKTSLVVTDSTVSGNLSSGGASDTFGGNAGGGGIYCLSSSLAITDSSITGNSVDGGQGFYTGGTASGGGIYSGSSSLAVLNCDVSGNDATGGGGVSEGGGSGGGLYVFGLSPVITNCTIVGNRVGTFRAGPLYGGGVYCNSSSPVITNCTFSKNNSLHGGGGISSFNSSSPVVTNCIFWADTSGEIYVDGTSGPVVAYSDIQGGYSGTGNKNSDPLFVAAGDYRLSELSPCINAGNNNAPNLPATDKDGNPRIVGGIVDMGAYEFQGGGTLIANFSGSPLSGVDPLTVNFTDQSTGVITSWSWNFGDGSGSQSQNPSHTYVNPGAYAVTLTVTGAAGSDSETKPNYITVTAPTGPSPDIKANGQNGPIVVDPAQTVCVSVALDPGDMPGEVCDWWIGASTPFGTYWVTPSLNWVRSDVPVSVGQYGLFDLPDRSLLNMSLPEGLYMFFFVLDHTADGAFGVTWYDYVNVICESDAAGTGDLPDGETMFWNKMETFKTK